LLVEATDDHGRHDGQADLIRPDGHDWLAAVVTPYAQALAKVCAA
jgi:hypothetical protein